MFSYGGGRRTAEQLGVHVLAELPLDPKVRIGGDSGAPVALQKGENAVFLELARNTAARAEEVAKQEGPKIEITD